MKKTTNLTLTFNTAKEHDFYEIKHFLKRNKTYSANRDDLIYLVRSNNALVATARLLNIEGSDCALWLRGLFVAEEFRHNKIASQLLEHIHTDLLINQKTDCIFAFAEPHLNHFYLQNQYQIIEPDLLPISLKQRFTNAQQQGKKWLCLMKPL